MLKEGERQERQVVGGGVSSESVVQESVCFLASQHLSVSVSQTHTLQLHFHFTSRYSCIRMFKKKKLT